MKHSRKEEQDDTGRQGTAGHAAGDSGETTLRGGSAAGSEAQYNILQSLIDSAIIPIFSVDMDCRYLTFNNSHASTMKSMYGADIKPGESYPGHLTVPEDREKELANLDRVLQKGERVLEESQFGSGASRTWLEIFHVPVADQSGRVIGVLMLARDISRRKEMEMRLKKQAHDLGERVKELHCLYNLSKLIEEKGNSLEDIYRGTVDLIPAALSYPELTCARLMAENRQYTTANWKETRYRLLADIFVAGAPIGRLEVCFLGEVPEGAARPFLKEERDLVAAIAERLGRVAERRHAEESILRSKMLLQSVIDATPDFIYVKDIRHCYLLVNRAFARSQGLEPQDMIGRPDTDFFSEELCFGNPEKGIVGFHSDDISAFQGHLVQNPGNVVTWADGSTHIYDTYKLPLRDHSGKIYAAMVFSRDSTARQDAEERKDAAIDMLHRTQEAIIDTMARVIEMRDPQTAGHQRRVSQLAEAIAREMELDEQSIDNLVMAARIHDIGKMYVPEDVLSKPERLTDIEFKMVVTHAQGSYDILWKAEFPQPVATIVLQHHERLDGSGYPNHLTGSEIMTESRILAVADVVDAITSNRPYRSAFGIDRALQEISAGSGTLFDAGAVEACVKLFSKKDFKFEE